MCIYKSQCIRSKLYLYANSHVKIQKNLYSFIKTYFLTDDNAYRRSLSSRRNTCMLLYIKILNIE